MAESATPLGTEDAAAQIDLILSEPDVPTDAEAAEDTSEDKPEEPNAVLEGDELTVEEDETEVEPTEVIDPPIGFSEAEREEFRSLSPEMQQATARRERDRDDLLSRTNREMTEQRRSHEVALSQVAAERQQYAERMGPLLQNLQESVRQEETELEALLEVDTDEYVRAKHRLDQKKAHLREANVERRKMAQQQQEENQLAYTAHLNGETEYLLKALPHWSDGEKARTERDRITSYLHTRGFTDEEINGANDHRTVLMARDAMLYREIQDKRKVAAKKVKGKPKAIRPGVAPDRTTDSSERDTALMKRLQESGGKDRDALVGLLQSRI